MNKFNEIISNLLNNKNSELFSNSLNIIKDNFRRFRYLIDYSSSQTCAKLDDFIFALPEHLIDVTSDEMFLSRMFAQGEVFDQGKIAVVESVNENDQELKVVFVFDKRGNLTRIEIKSETLNLTLNGDEKAYDLAVLEMMGNKNLCLKLVKTLKDCYSLTKAPTSEDVFETVISLDPKVIDQKSEGINKMVEHWNELAKNEVE